MEKKTIGTFIATLRKANGLTQKQLAEKLCVSDKAVSRWERDECAPDLTLIPVIAELFGITTDELLRGQRNNPDCAAPASHSEAKVQLQTKRILKNTLTKYQTQSILCFGIALLGLLVALVCNFGFLMGPLGFILGCVCTAAAGVLLVIFTIEAKAALEDVEFEPELIHGSRLSIFRICCRTVTAVAVLFALTLPLTMVYDTYMGIAFDSWLLYGLIFAAIAGGICVTVSAVTQLKLSKKEILILPEENEKSLRLGLRFLGITILVLVGLLIVQGIANIFLPEWIRNGTTFDNWDDFKEFMETPAGYSWYENGEQFIVENIDEYSAYYPSETITDANGNILCQYIVRNQNVTSTSFSFDTNENGLPVTVSTAQDYQRANLIMEELVNPIFILAYIATVLGSFILYRVKSKHLS